MNVQQIQDWCLRHISGFFKAGLIWSVPVIYLGRRTVD